jgi:hypothetical protein
MDGNAVAEVRALLDRCRVAGLKIHVERGSTLRLESPRGPPPPELLDALRARKAFVVEYLGDARATHAHPCAGCGRLFYREPATLCYWCRRRLDGLPLGAPCLGCGEACEECLGMEPGHGT